MKQTVTFPVNNLQNDLDYFIICVFLLLLLFSRNDQGIKTSISLSQKILLEKSGFVNVSDCLVDGHFKEALNLILVLSSSLDWLAIQSLLQHMNKLKVTA